MTDDQIWAILYSRFSPRPKDEAASTETLELQLEACRAYCLSRGWKVVGEYMDPEESGKNLDRPGIKAALEHLDKLPRGALVVYRQNRLTRSKRDLLTLYERFKKAGHVLALLDLGIDTSTPTGEAVLFTLAAWDERERKEIGIKTKEACTRYQRNGRSVGGRPPYGWYRDFANARIPLGGKRAIVPLEPHPDEQPVLKMIFMAADAGESAQRIATTLRNTGLTARDGGRWSSNTIFRIVARNMRPVGEFALKSVLDVADNAPVPEPEAAPTAGVPSPSDIPW